MFLLGVFVLAVLSGGTASVAGFGIGSLLTPLLAATFGTATAVAAVAIPHAAATALRCWRLRANIDWSVVRGFGLLSAAGGLHRRASLHTLLQRCADAHAWPVAPVNALATLVDLPSRVRVTRIVVGVLGLLSGLFGGLAGNQGGLRAAAMLSLSLSPVRYVATATATAMLVDIVRTPIYVWRAGGVLTTLSPPVECRDSRCADRHRAGRADPPRPVDPSISIRHRRPHRTARSVARCPGRELKDNALEGAMNWTRTLVCLIVGFLVAAHTARAQDVKSDQEVLIDLERKWDEAFHSQNAEFIEGVLADEFVATYGDGTRGDKAKELALARQFDQQVDSSHARQLHRQGLPRHGGRLVHAAPGRTRCRENRPRFSTGTWTSGSCVMVAGRQSPAKARGWEASSRQYAASGMQQCLPPTAYYRVQQFPKQPAAASPRLSDSACPREAPMVRFTKVIIPALLVTLLPTSAAFAESLRHERRDRIEDRFDRREDRRDVREDRRDAREDVRDARHQGGWRDRREDRWDVREDRRDLRENRRDHREDRRDRRH